MKAGIGIEPASTAFAVECFIRLLLDGGNTTLQIVKELYAETRDRPAGDLSLLLIWSRTHLPPRL